MVAPMKCPCCGQVIPAVPLLVDLDTNIITNGKMKVQLFPLQAVMAHTLIKRMPAVVPYEALTMAIWGQEGASNAALKAHAHNLQVVMEHLGYYIQFSYGVGYRLVPIDFNTDVIPQNKLLRKRRVREVVSKLEIVK